LTLALLGALALPTAAAEKPEEDPAKNTDAILDIMPDMQYRFEILEELIEEQKWEHVLQRVEELTEEAGETVWSSDGRLFLSVTDYAHQRLMSLPPEGLAFYRMRYDGTALAMLQEGLRRHDVGLLERIASKYPASSHAEAGLDAAANVLIDQGRYAAAAARLERLLARPVQKDATRAETERRAMALAKLGFCRAKLGDLTAMRTIDQRLKAGGFRGRVMVGDGQDAMAFLKRTLAQDTKTTVKARDEWPSAAGHSRHRRPMVKLGTDLSRRWAVKIGEDENAHPSVPQQVTVDTIIYRPPNMDPPKMQTSPWPVVDAEGVVYINTGTGLYALDHITGRLRWATKPKGVVPPETNPNQWFLIGGTAGLRQVKASWSRWAGATSASIGGGRVYATEARSHSLLALGAFDASSGKRLWEIEQTLAGGDFTNEIFFPWAPRYFDGRLVGVAMQREQAFLVALDAATGAVQWRVFLASDPLLAVALNGHNALRPEMGQHVVVADGVAYATTGMGVIAAVEIESGQLRWIRRYPRSNLSVKEVGTPGRTRIQHEIVGAPWEVGFPVIENGKLYVPAWDATALMIFDGATGQMLRAIPRDQFTHFAGVRDGVAFLVGPQTAAMDTQTGLLRWMVPTPFEVQGAPVLTEASLVIPLSGTLCFINLDGSVTRTLRPLAGANERLLMGNLLSHEGRLIAANIAYVRGYFSYEKTYALLTSLIEKHPQAAKELLDRGDLSLLHAGVLTDAARIPPALHRALNDFQTAERRMATQRPADPALASRLKRAMFETRLKLAEVEPHQAIAHIDHAKAYRFNPPANLRWALARGAALAAEKHMQDAVDAYLTIVEKMQGQRLSEDESTMIAEVIAQSRIGDLVARHGGEVYARVDQSLKPRFTQLVEAKDFDGLQALQAQHPHSSLADNCLYAMAQIALPREHGALRAQVLLQGLIRRYPTSDVLGEAYAMLLQTCESNRQYRLGALILRELPEQHPKVKVPWNGRTQPGTNWAAAMLKQPEYAQALAALNRPLPVLAEALQKSWTSGSGAEVLVEFVSDETPMERGIGLAVDCFLNRKNRRRLAENSHLRAFNLDTGKTLWKTKLDVLWTLNPLEKDVSRWSRSRYTTLGMASANIVAIGHAEGVVAFDLLTGKRVWSRTWKLPEGHNPMVWFSRLQVDYRTRISINPRPTFAAEGGHLFYLIPDGTLVCLDAATGKTLWDTKLPGYATGPIGLFGDLVVVATLAPAEMHAFRVLDGKTVYRKPIPGLFPQPPTYDRIRNRILIADGTSLASYEAADFRKLWSTKLLFTREDTQPWSIQITPDDWVLAMYRNQAGHVYGDQASVLNGTTGKRQWAYMATKTQNDAANNKRTTRQAIYAPLFTRTKVLLPLQEQSSHRQGQRFSSIVDHSTHVLDLETGKKLGEHLIKANQRKLPNGSVTGQVRTIAVFSTAKHLIRLTQEYDQAGKALGMLRVGNLDTGKTLLEDTMPASLFGRNMYMLQRGVMPVVTPDGGLLIPSGNGIQYYSPKQPKAGQGDS
jgi:outer membrane protein assembly factor BamB